MMRIVPLESTESLSELKSRYMQQTTAPLDGMWLCGFVPMATHFGLYDDRELMGYFCVNDEGYLLQFFVDEAHQNGSTDLFELILRRDDMPTGKINGAFVSTAEPRSLSVCLDWFSRFDVNALMYQFNRDQRKPAGVEQSTADSELTVIDGKQLNQAVDFAVASIGAPTEWLNGYYANLIQRQELFGVWQNGRLIATGESRGYDEYQTEYADIGVIVAKPERGKGMATRVLRQLVAMNEANGLKSICSTETANVAAQKAISRAGFFAGNQILQFHAS